MNNQTSGHCANSMGVRGHSAGTVFPAVIVIKGNPFEVLTYHVINHPFIDPDTGYHSYHIAEGKASLTPRYF